MILENENISNGLSANKQFGASRELKVCALPVLKQGM
jgi:hypothetical protein